MLRSVFISPQLIGVMICLASAARLSADWVDQRVIDIFEVRSEFELSGSEAELLMTEIKLLRNDIEQYLHLEVGTTPIEVNLFSTRSSYQKSLSVRVPDGVRRTALFVKSADKGRVYAYQHRDFSTDVRHECTHALLHNALSYVPMWLDEGLAEYFEVPAAKRSKQNPHLKSVRWAMRIRWDPSLPELEGKHDHADFDSSDYRDSWAWAHYLLHGPAEARQVLSNYLYDIHIGRPAGQLSERLAQKVPDVQQSMVDHFKDWR